MTTPTKEMISTVRHQISSTKIGVEKVELLGTYQYDGREGNDNTIHIYNIGGYRAADTNGEPIFEEEDAQVFAELLAHCGID